jgi:hypothetical protein
MASEQYDDLYFTVEQLFLSQEEALAVAREFWGVGSLTAASLTDKDRAFIQRSLLIAVDKSEKAGFLFDLYSSATKAAVSQSLKKLVTSLAKKTARRWFKRYIDDTPQISAVGKSAVQYSGYASEWRVRRTVDGGDEWLTNYLVR